MIGGDVAVFIDFENIRYSLRNIYGGEPDISALMDRARKYGNIAVAVAYADFSEHPGWIRRQMDIAGITARDVPLRKVTRDGTERVKSSADIHMVMDVMETVLDRPNINTYLLMSGDSDFIRLVSWLRNRFGKTVVIAGVPGATSQDLVTAAGGKEERIEVSPPSPSSAAGGKKERIEVSPPSPSSAAGDKEERIEVSPPSPSSAEEIIEAIIRMVHVGRPPLGYWTARLIDQWANNARNDIPGTAEEKKAAIGSMLQEGILEQRAETRGRRPLKVAYLKEDHSRVQEAIGKS